MSRRVYLALFAVLAELVAIAATGNQGVTNFVADHMATSPLGDLFLRSLPTFAWRFTPTGARGATTILVAQYAAIGTLLVLTFVLMLIVVRGSSTFSGPFFSAIPIVVVSALGAKLVASIVEYNQVGRLEHTGLGRFGYALFHSSDNTSIMFSLMCGVWVALVVGIVGVILRRRAVAAAERAAEASAANDVGPMSATNEFFAPSVNPWGTTEQPAYAPAADEPTLASYGGPGVDPGSPVDPASTAEPATSGFSYPPQYEGDSFGPGEHPDAPVADAPVAEPTAAEPTAAEPSEPIEPTAERPAEPVAAEAQPQSERR